MSAAPARVPRPFRSIVTLLIQRVVLLAILVTVVLGGALAALEYESSRASRERMVRLLAQSSLPVLSTALWDVETETVERQLQRVADIPEVGHVRLRMATGPVFSAGSQGAEGMRVVPVLALHVPAPVKGRNDLGVLEIWLDEGHIRRHTLGRVLAILGSFVLFTACICIMVAWVLRRELLRPLRRIARFVENLQPGQMGEPLELQRTRLRRMDEIDLVAQGFKHMQQDIRQHIDLLDRRVAQRTQELQRTMEKVMRLSLTDALTGCANRRFIDERLPSEVLRCRRYGRPLGVVFVDIDHFKSVNDELGHAAGDAVLRTLAQIYAGELRAGIDWIARYGGEEFVILLPESTASEADAFARRLLLITRALEIPFEGRQIRVSASFGVAGYRSPETVEQLLARVDALLYKAKEDGRDCVRSDLA